MKGKNRKPLKMMMALAVSLAILTVASPAALGAAGGTSRDWAHDSIGVTAPSTQWYLAEGATAGGFETWILVQNPGAETANVSLTFYTENGPVDGPRIQLAAQSRHTFNAGDYVTTYNVSTKVTSDKGVVCERAMYGNGRTWAHDSIGAIATSTDWYLAEGATMPGFETWLLLQNPGTEQANVSLTFYTEKGPVEGPHLSVPAQSRRSLNVGDYVTTYNVSTKVTSDKGVVCERAMYGNNRQWADDSIGATAPATEWYMAEGATMPGFETWVLVENPGDADADVSLTFFTDKGLVDGPRVKVAARSRSSFNIGDYVTTYNVSTKVTSDKGVVCERAMYGTGRVWAHDSIGATSPSPHWYLAEGATMTGFETWVLVQNPDTHEADVTLTFYTDKGQVAGPHVKVPARSRQTFNVGDYVKTYEVSTMVTSDTGIVCERAMYGSATSHIACPLDGTPLYPFTKDASIACGHWPAGSTDYPYFGAPRNGTRLHAGVDIYPPAGAGSPVYAIEDGTVIKVEPFYTRANGEVTYGMLVDHGDCVVNYGEVQPPSLKVGAHVSRGQVIAHVGGTVQLHFELYTPGTTSWLQWYGAQPSNLLDPTPLMLGAFGL
jgi:murein DD-endopeptidase MepM/ murein hydrolase activator NlpD